MPVQFADRLPELLDAMPDAVVIVGPDGTILYANRQIEELSGWQPAELVGEGVERLVPPRLAAGHRAHRAGYVGSGSPVRAMGVNLDIVLARIDGTEVPVDIALSPLPGPDGTLTVASIRDATERRAAQAQLQASHDVAQALLAGEHTDLILNRLAHHARTLARADVAAVVTSREPGREVLQAAATGAGHPGLDADVDELVGIETPTHETDSAAVPEQGPATLIDDLAADSSPHQALARRLDLGPAMRIPLAARGNRFGVLLVANRRGANPLTESDLELVGRFADQVAVALEYDRARQEVDRLVLVEDQERIARDLHDTVIQRLFATGMALQATTRLGVPSVAAERIQQAIADLDETILEIRSTIFALQSPPQAAGVRGEVLRLAAESAPGLGFRPSVRFEGPVDTTVPDHAVPHLLATVREALSNVARHAAATRAEVVVTVNGGLVLTIADNGKGGAADGAAPGGMGLRNMAERARRLGGQFEVADRADGGTVVTWTVPVAPG